MDADEDKYARRPMNERLAQVVANQLQEAKRLMPHGHDDVDGLKKAAIVLLLVVIGGITLIELMTRAGSGSREDPLLDPDANPNLRVMTSVQQPPGGW